MLSNKCGFQLQYQMIFCVWLLAFSPQLCEQLRRYNVVPALSDILQESVKEKVTRIILAAFRVSGEMLTLCMCVCVCASKMLLFTEKGLPKGYSILVTPFFLRLLSSVLANKSRGSS